MDNEDDTRRFKGFNSDELKKVLKKLDHSDLFFFLKGIFWTHYIEGNTDSKYRKERMREIKRELLLRGEINQDAFRY